MKFDRVLKALLCYFIAFVMVEVPFALRAQAGGMISTADVVSDLADRENRAKVSAFLQREDVKNQFIGYGVSAAEAEQRIASLSPAEIQSLAAKIDQAPAGAGVEGVLIIVILVILIIFLLKRV